MTNIIFYVALICWDLGILLTLRSLLYSFLLSKKNPKGAKKIHKMQSKKDKFTLSYIKEYTPYLKDFMFYRRWGLIYICITPVTYIFMLVLEFISLRAFYIVVMCLMIIKMILIFILSRNFDGSRISRFDKRWNKRH